MKKYLVIVDAARQSYSTNSQLCGIFDTEDEAIKWVLNNQTIMVTDDRGDEYQFTIRLKNFDFNLYKWVEIPQSELREFIREHYIVEFDGSPICVGFYEE